MGWGAGLATERGGGRKDKHFFALAVSRRTRGLDKASNGNFLIVNTFPKRDVVIDANLEAHTIIFSSEF